MEKQKEDLNTMQKSKKSKKIGPIAVFCENSGIFCYYLKYRIKNL